MSKIFLLSLALVGIFYIVKDRYENNNIPMKNTSVQKSDKVRDSIVELCVDTFKNSGLEGIKIISREAYENLGVVPTLEGLKRCAVIDMFGNIMDSQAAKENGFPVDEYFEVLSFQERIGIPLMKSGLTMEESNHYLLQWEVEVKDQLESLSSEVL